MRKLTDIHPLAKRVLANTFLLCVGLVIAALLGELAVRWLAPQVRQYSVALRRLYVRDAELGYAMAPRISRDVRTHAFVSHVDTNRLGLRNEEIAPKDSSTIRIVGIGDSFTFGIHAGSLQNCYLKQLEKLANARLATRDHLGRGRAQVTEFVNAGVDGYSTVQEVGLLERLGSSLQPDGVLLEFYLGNDFTDNSGRTRMTVEDGYLMLEASAAPYRQFARPLHRRIRLYLNAHSELYVFLKRHILEPVRAMQEMPAGTSSSRRYLHEYVFDEGFAASLSSNPSSTIQTGTEITRQALQELRSWCDANGVRALVFAIPEAVQVDDQARREWIHRFGLENEALDFRLPNKRLRQLADETGLPLVDLTDGIETAVRSGESVHLKDHHWTAAGHAIAADLLIDDVMHELVDPSTHIEAHP